MTGKPYIGVNNKAVIPRTIYAGVNNIARKVSAAYVGDENNRAKKIWPVSVLPNGYQQVEWIDFLTNKNAFLPYVGLVFQPRIVINFKTHSYIDNDSGDLFGNQYEHISTDRKTRYYITAKTLSYGPNQPGFSLTNYKTISGDTNYYGIRNYYTNRAEGLLTDSTYTLDFNNIKNGISNYYLYCDKGFYSIPRNNLLTSHSKIDLSALSYDQSYRTSYFLLNSYVPGHDGTSGEHSYTAKIIFYNCAMYDNSGDNSGDMIHDYYPCYRKSDRQMGLYDLIDRIFLTPYYHVASSRPVENTDYKLGPEV